MGRFAVQAVTLACFLGLAYNKLSTARPLGFSHCFLPCQKNLAALVLFRKLLS